MADVDTAEGINPGTAPTILPEPTPEPTATPQPENTTVKPAPRRSGFAGGVLGGLIAAGAGFGLAQYVPAGWPIADTSALTTELASQAKQIVALNEKIPAPDTSLQDRIAVLEALPAPAAPDLTTLESRLTDIESRLAAIEALPVGAGMSPAATAAQDAALQALQAEVEALKTASTPANVQAITAKAEVQLKEAEAEAAQIKADAEALTKSAQAQATLGRLQSAIDSGAPFADLLPTLPDLPAVLKDNAETGIPSLTALQDSFPAAARAALEAALRANMGESWSERVTSFLRTQTGVRSLEPREGTDPDAILSRAEAAISNGDLTVALTEIVALPSEAQPALEEWRASAELHVAAVKAAADLAALIGE